MLVLATVPCSRTRLGVSNVVFPTAIETIDGVRCVFDGMANAKIGVVRLNHAPPSTYL